MGGAEIPWRLAAPWGHGPANIGGAGGDRPADILIHFVGIIIPLEGDFVGIIIPLEGDVAMRPVSPRFKEILASTS